jgi:hypothetical protein
MQAVYVGAAYVHGGALAHRLQTFQNLDGTASIFIGFIVYGPRVAARHIPFPVLRTFKGNQANRRLISFKDYGLWIAAMNYDKLMVSIRFAEKKVQPAPN